MGAIDHGGALQAFFEALSVEGVAAGSVLVEQINHAKEPHMPDDRPKLSVEVIAKITAWINDGAPYAEPLVAGKKPKRDASVVTNEDRQWWSFLPLKKVNAKSIDELLLKQAKGMTFNPPADKATLVRRLYLDLTGLPPPEGADAGDLNEITDKLLASPRYGERWARHWLDVARYADTNGDVVEEERRYPFAYTYRDYVITALNADKPFDQFIREQIAGDVMQPITSDGVVATSLLVCGPYDDVKNLEEKVVKALVVSPATGVPAPMRTLNSPPEMVTFCCSE